mgnify:CR=1 FL=1
MRFRRALSLAIDRVAGQPGALLRPRASRRTTPCSPAARSIARATATPGRATTARQANRLLDEMGLKRGLDGIRHLPDGRQARDHHRDRGREHRADRRAGAGARDLARGRHQLLQQAVAARGVPQPRLRRRDGDVGLERHGERPADAETSPDELAPTSQLQLQWPKFGQWYETSGKVGEAPDIAEVQELARALRRLATHAADDRDRARIWQRMLEIHVEQQFTHRHRLRRAAAGDRAPDAA